MGIAVRRSGFLEDIDVEDSVGLRRVCRFGLYGVEDTGIDIDHTAGGDFESNFCQSTAGFVVVVTGEHALGGDVFSGGDAVAAGDDLEVAVAGPKPVGIVEDLDIGAISLGEIHRIFVFPVVVVLVEGGRADTTRGEVEGGVAEVVVVVDRLLQEGGDKGIFDKPMADGAAIVPWADEIWLGLRIEW